MRITLKCLILLSSISPAFGQDIRQEPEIPDNGGQQTETDTSIEGDLNTSNSNSNNGNVTKTYNGAGSSGMPANTAIAPTLMSSGSESCLQSISGGVQLVGFGLSSGRYMQDEECNRRRNAVTLSNMGMKIAAVSLMCQNPDVWRAMLMAATPCPIIKYGKIVVGKRALIEIKQRPALYISDYDDRRDYYEAVLGIGVEDDEQEDTDGSSLSSRFRTTTSTDGS